MAKCWTGIEHEPGHELLAAGASSDMVLVKAGGRRGRGLRAARQRCNGNLGMGFCEL